MTFFDRIKETSTSTGTSTFTLSGAVTGYVAFTNGTYKYCIVNNTETEWEVGEGTVASGVLTRTTIEASSNAGSAVNFSAGTKYVFNTVSAAYVNSLVPYTGATASVNLGEFGLTAGQLTLDTSPTGTAVVGTTQWNDTIGSSQTLLKGGNVLLKNGVDLVARVVNKVSPATTLTKAAYQAVRVSGAQGQRLAISYAQANNDNNSADTIGLVCETIAANQEGFIITVGQLENINTTGSLQGETWADGDVLYLSPTTAGALTNVKPNGSTGHIIIIGYVEYAHANNGKIYVKVMNGWELDELHNVYISSVANNQVLTYESATDLWKNKSIATALGYTPANDSLVMHLAGTETATGVKTFSIGLATTTGDNFMNTSSGNLLVGYAATPATNTYKLNVNGDVYNYGKNLVKSNISGGNTVFFDVQNYSGTSLFSITTGSIATITASATFTNNITFTGKLATANSSGLSIVGGSFPASLSQSQLMFLISAPLNNYTSTYGLNEQGIFLGGTYNGGQGPTRLVLGPSLYYNNGSVATGVWDFTITPASGQITDGYGSSLILAGGRGRGTGTPGKFIVQTSTATTTGTTLQTLSNRLEVDGTGQLKLNGYTSTSVFTGTVAGLLGFDSSGNIITTSASGGGGISGSGTAGQVTYWSGTSAVTGSSNLFWDNTNARLGIGTNAPSSILDISTSGNSPQVIRINNVTNNTGASAGIEITSGARTGSLFMTSPAYSAFGVLSAGSLGFYTAASGGNIAIAVNSTGYFAIGTGSSTPTEKFRIFNGGNVLIQNGGTFTDNGYRLDVQGTGATAGALRVTGGNVQFGSSTGLNWDNTNSRLGIGTSSPSVPLQITGTASIIPQLTLNAVGASNNSNYINYSVSGSNKYQFGYTQEASLNRFFIYNNTTARNTLTLFEASGNVLISNAAIISDLGGIFNISGSKTAVSAIARAVYFNNTLVAAANNDVLVALDIDPTFTLGSFTGVSNLSLRTTGKVRMSSLPTSATGLSTGDLWNNSGIINIV